MEREGRKRRRGRSVGDGWCWERRREKKGDFNPINNYGNRLVQWDINGNLLPQSSAKQGKRRSLFGPAWIM
jgi:hypothetical protein